MKFLMSVFREAMSEFFGKRGMPWHGCMLVRRPLRFEADRYGEGEFVCEYKHAMMLASKEDGFATLSAVHIALSEYKSENPHVSSALVKTDGAAAYAGATFTLGLSFLGETTGIVVRGHFIGEAGQNKSTLDGEFAVSGSQVRRLICSGLHDVRTPSDLFHGLEKVLSKQGGRTVALFRPAGSEEFAVETIARLTLMSAREYVYDGSGSFEALLLRRQPFLGEGERLTSADLFPDGRVAPTAPQVVASTSRGAGSSGQHELVARSDDRGREGKADRKLVARSDRGREARAKAKAERKEAAQAKVAAERRRLASEASVARSTARSYRCCDMPGGMHGCDRVFVRLGALNRHLEQGRTNPDVHQSGYVRCYPAGAPVGRASAGDVLARAVAAQAGRVTIHGGEGGLASPTLCPVAELQLTLCDGTVCKPTPPEAGYAGNQQGRSKPRRKSAMQLTYVLLVGHDVKDEKGYENLHGHEASQLMLEWGTAGFASRFAGVGNAAATQDGQPHLPRTAQLSASELTPLLMLPRAKLEARILKLKAKERRPWVAAKTRKRKRSAVPAGRKQKPDSAAILRSARVKLRRAGWDIAAAVGQRGGRRADRLTVPELKALVAGRGWKLGKGEKANQGPLLALAERKRKEARDAHAGRHGGVARPEDGLDECWAPQPEDEVSDDGAGGSEASGSGAAGAAGGAGGAGGAGAGGVAGARAEAGTAGEPAGDGSASEGEATGDVEMGEACGDAEMAEAGSGSGGGGGGDGSDGSSSSSSSSSDDDSDDADGPDSNCEGEGEDVASSESESESGDEGEE